MTEAAAAGWCWEGVAAAAAVVVGAEAGTVFGGWRALAVTD